MVSVVVPTHDRGALLSDLVEALAGQDYPANRFEVIIADDGSTDCTTEVVERLRGEHGLELRYRRKERSGPASARNFGAAQATGELLAFTDSDCLPVRGWLRESAAAMKPGVGLVCGPVRPVGRAGFMDAQLAEITADDGLYPTANLVIRRTSFEAVGGFDERFGLVPGEDTDLAWRIKRRGEGAVFAPAAAVGHRFTPLSLQEFLLRPTRQWFFARLLRDVPELRRTHLWGGYFYAPDHLYFLLALGGIGGAIATRWWAVALLALPWLRTIGPIAWERARKGRPDLAVAILLLTTYRVAVTTLALLAGSVRYRRLVI
jgi:glycosyltransferase involved in cell wall biosynthesis